jgi:hypothetical protein
MDAVPETPLKPIAVQQRHEELEILLSAVVAVRWSRLELEIGCCLPRAIANIAEIWALSGL